MSIVKRQTDASYQILSGERRLKIQLELTGQARVLDAESHEILFVHEVSGQLRQVSKDMLTKSPETEKSTAELWEALDDGQRAVFIKRLADLGVKLPSEFSPEMKEILPFLGTEFEHTEEARGK